MDPSDLKCDTRIWEPVSGDRPRFVSSLRSVWARQPSEDALPRYVQDGLARRRARADAIYEQVTTAPYPPNRVAPLLSRRSSRRSVTPVPRATAVPRARIPTNDAEKAQDHGSALSPLALRPRLQSHQQRWSQPESETEPHPESRNQRNQQNQSQNQDQSQNQYQASSHTQNQDQYQAYSQAQNQYQDPFIQDQSQDQNQYQNTYAYQNPNLNPNLNPDLDSNPYLNPHLNPHLNPYQSTYQNLGQHHEHNPYAYQNPMQNPYQDPYQEQHRQPQQNPAPVRAEPETTLVPYQPGYRGDINNPRNQGATIPEAENCAVWISNLPPSCTINLLAKSLLKTGKIYASNITPPNSGHETAAAKVVFFHREAVDVLFKRLAAIGGSLDVGGYAARMVPNFIKAAAQQETVTSRVLLISGPTSVVIEQTLSDLFARHNIAYDTDALIIIRENHVRQTRTLEWRFASFRAQASAAMRALRAKKNDVNATDDEKAAWTQVSVRWGRDPCE
ncbi:Uu.00g004150.m01.CDS01 [Anthostomella pinea]|uniref:Uu.00g004150.m01.CDS01 n=1 Tax=Anthostomella pinea TaxID=933095 RepID=A0AAI8YIS0_9PEZI|nr:Uu.00g004150.m01.CDS01 [Anthostomella pinea]